VEEEAVKKTGDSGVLPVATSVIAYVISVMFPVRIVGMTGNRTVSGIDPNSQTQASPGNVHSKNNTFIIRVE